MDVHARSRRPVLLELLALVAVAYLAGLAFQRRDMLNSDTLLPAQYSWDLAHHSFAFANFELPRIPSLFPDLAVYLPLDYFLDFRWAYFLYAVFQICSYALAGGGVIALVTGTRWLRASALLLLTFSISFIIDYYWYPETNLNQILVPVVHFGALLSSLVAAVLLLLLLRRWSLVLAVLLVALGFASFLSNKMYLLEFIAPAGAALLVLVVCGAARPLRAIGLFALCILGPALAPLADRFLTRQPDSSVDIDFTFSKLVPFLRHIPFYFSSVGLTLTVFIPLLIWIVAPLLWRARGAAPSKGGAPAMRLHAYFGSPQLLFIWVFSLAAAAACVVLEVAKFEGGMPSRYMAALIFWPQLWVAILLLQTPIRVWIGRLALAATVLVAGVFLLRTDRPDKLQPALLRWEEPAGRCVAEQREPLGLKAGLADYWVASAVTATLDWSLQVNQVDGDGFPTYWGNDIMWYLHADDDPSKPPPYNFIVLNKLKEEKVREHYGPPDRIGRCGDTLIWAYDDSDKFYARMLAGSRILDRLRLSDPAGLCIPALALPSSAGRLEGMSRIAEEGSSQSGTLTFGPYLRLQAGTYALSMTYAANGTGAKPSRWDVDKLGPGSFFKGPLPDTHGETQTVGTTVTLPNDLEGLEVRSFYEGNGTLRVDRVCARRLDGGNDGKPPIH